MAQPSVEFRPIGDHAGRTRFSGGYPFAARRVLVVAPQPFYQDRGTPIALLQVLQALSQLDYRVDLLTFPVGADIALPGLRIFRAGNPLGIQNVPVGLSVRKVALDLRLVTALRSRLERDTYSCVHALEEAAWPALTWARRHRLPLLYDMQSSLPEQLRKYRLARIPPIPAATAAAERWLLTRADLVVASLGLANRVQGIAPGTPVREWRFPSAPAEVDPAETVALRQRLGLPAGAPVVMYSGTFETYQGLADLVAAIPAVRAQVPAARFILIGADEGNRGPVGGAAEHLVREGILTVVDRQPRSAMPVFLSMADVLVSPRAFGGNLPFKIFDYLAAGRAIVATDISTHRTVLTDQLAVLVQPRPHAIAEGIVSLLCDTTRRRALGAAAREYAIEHLGWNGFVESVAEIYDEAHRHAPV
jgi:glycosyltransferase involved in cell wall biosynthesis